jgi:trehalose/maltose transport system substrate-binding protein
VNYREMPSDTGHCFDQLRTEFQAGGGDIDVITGDVIWPAQFSANGYILDPDDPSKVALDSPSRPAGSRRGTA